VTMDKFSILSKVKQIVTEKFDKSKKTQDDAKFLGRIEVVQAKGKKIQIYLDNCKQFSLSIATIIENNRIFGESMQLLNQGTAYEGIINGASVKLNALEIHVKKIQGVQVKLERNTNTIIEKISKFLKLIETREEQRVQYDYYRNKLNEMERPGKEAHSRKAEDQEKYSRNQTKFDKAKETFDESTREANHKLE